MNQQFQNIIDSVQQNENLSADEKTALIKAIKKADSDFTISEFKLERTEKVKRITGILLEETIEELDKKRKAVEAQNRKLEIENALEKVRSRTMAMMHSDELAETSFLLDSQVRALGIKTWGCAFNIYREKDSIEWFGNEAGVLPMYTVPRKSIFKKYYEQGQKGSSFFVQEIVGEKCIAHYEFMCTLPVIGDVLKQLKITNGTFPDYQIDHVAYFKYGYLLFITIESVPEAHDIFKRFAQVFEQTYTRFLDLQKAEAQTKEAQIETALEKVRSRSMGMQKSEELHDVIQVIYDQLIQLEFNIDGAGFAIEFRESDDWNLWTADRINPIPYKIHIPYFDHPMSNAIIEAKKNNLELLVISLTKGEKNLLYEQMFKYVAAPKEVRDAIFSYPGYVMSKVLLEKVDLYISNFTGYLYTDEEHATLLRFGKVFEQAYTRFNDLKQAEAQAREARIETALEKVRSRSLAMHKSDELQEVINTIYDRLIELDIKVDSVNFNIFSEGSKDSTVWTGVGGKLYRHPQHLPYIDFGPTKGMWVAKEDGQNFFSKQYSFDKKNKWWSKAFEVSDLKHMPKDRKKLIIKAEGYTVTMAIEKFSCLQLNRYSNELFTEKDQNVTKRFAKVFEQTYTRFLDLQKAEAQTRESQIEASLERVRAKAMSMHSSEDLTEMVGLLFKELSALEIDLIRCGVGRIHEDRQVDLYNFTLSDDGELVPVLGKALLKGHPALNTSFEGWKDQKERHVVLKGKSLKKYYELIKAEFKLPTQENHQVHYGYFFYFPAGTLYTYTRTELTEDQLNIYRKFSSVVGLTYRRFLDLEEAEAQTREVQIETALERVRSRTMGMQKSEELSEVIQVIYEQLIELNFNIDGAGFAVDHRESDDWDIWQTDGFVPQPYKLHIPYFDHPLPNAIIKAKKDGLELLTLSLTFDEKNKLIDESFKYVSLPQELIEAVYSFPGYVISKVLLKNVDLYITRYTCIPFTNAENAILVRFAKVFEQTYTRFNDIKQAEERAKEVLKQSSLDRLRAKIASMRTATDLEQITPSIWHELDNLGVPFIRCGVFITNEENQFISTYLSAPNGQALAAFELPYDINEVAVNIVLNWKKKEIYQTSWSKKEFLTFMADLIEEGLLKDPESYQGAEQPPEHLYLNFAPFKQGMIYVGNVETLSADELDLVQSIANAFSIAYARYEDFNQLEKAKKSVDDSLIELKATQAQLIQSEKMASLGELTAGIAHEIQNPLNFVNNFSEVSNELIDEMKEEIDSANYDEVKEIADIVKLNLEKINHHGKRADDIVKGMLQHSRSGSTTKELTDINKLADEYLRLAYHGLRAKDKTFNATLNTDFDEAVGSINVLPQDIGRVILNLITNAFYVVNEKKKQHQVGYEPTVTVKTKKTGQKVTILVKDNGNGIPKHIIDKIFQPFFTTKPTGQGTGLGLSLSYDIVKAHDGTLLVETNENEGTGFIIQLPI